MGPQGPEGQTGGKGSKGAQVNQRKVCNCVSQSVSQSVS